MIDRFIRPISSGFMFFEPVGQVVDTQKYRSVVKIAAVTRSFVRRRRSLEVMKEEFKRQVRIDRIKQAQEEEKWIANLTEFLIGDITKLSVEETKLCARIASEYEVDESGLLFYALDQR